MIVNGVTISEHKVQLVKDTRGILSPAHAASQCGLTAVQVREIRKRLDEQGICAYQIKEPVRVGIGNSVLQTFALSMSLITPRQLSADIGVESTTIRNILRDFCQGGFIHRLGTGKYFISSKGIKAAESKFRIKVANDVRAKVGEIESQEQAA